MGFVLKAHVFVIQFKKIEMVTCLGVPVNVDKHKRSKGLCVTYQSELVRKPDCCNPISTPTPMFNPSSFTYVFLIFNRLHFKPFTISTRCSHSDSNTRSKVFAPKHETSSDIVTYKKVA